MQMKFILFSRSSNGVILFAIPKNGILAIINADSFHLKLLNPNFYRHESFESAVCKRWGSCCLYEHRLITHESLLIDGLSFDNFLTFPLSIKMLNNGTDKNLLQLAVQFISNGGIVDDVIAADYDLNFIQELQKNLNESEIKKDKNNEKEI